MALPDIDEHGVIRDGPFAGLKAEEVFEFAERAASTQERERVDAPPSTTKTPADALKAASAARTDPMNQFTFTQFERIDEEDFSKTVPDYDKYREKIANVKKTMSAEQRAQRGVHKFIYQNVRMDDPEVQKVIFGVIPPPGTVVEEKPDDEVHEVSAEEETPAEAPVKKPAVSPVPKAGPKPVPSPVAKPTPRSATTPTAVAKSALKATPKIIALAERYSMTVDEYLSHLENQGYTQEQLNNLSLPSSARSAQSNRPRSIYDR
jgi:hypothetical protein